MATTRTTSTSGARRRALGILAAAALLALASLAVIATVPERPPQTRPAPPRRLPHTAGRSSPSASLTPSAPTSATLGQPSTGRRRRPRCWRATARSRSTSASTSPFPTGPPSTRFAREQRRHRRQERPGRLRRRPQDAVLAHRPGDQGRPARDRGADDPRPRDEGLRARPLHRARERSPGQPARARPHGAVRRVVGARARVGLLSRSASLRARHSRSPSPVASCRSCECRIGLRDPSRVCGPTFRSLPPCSSGTSSGPRTSES